MSVSKTVLFLIVFSIYASTVLTQISGNIISNDLMEQTSRSEIANGDSFAISGTMLVLQWQKEASGPPVKSAIDFHEIRLISIQSSTGTTCTSINSLFIINQEDGGEKLPGATNYSLASTTSSEINTYLICILNEIDQSLVLIILPALVTTLGVTNKNKAECEEENAVVTFQDSFSLRELICQVIEQSPGIHFRELCRELNRKNGVVQYHLWTLASENRIKTHQNGGFTRYFPAKAVYSEKSAEIYYSLFSMLQRPSMYKIIDLLLISESSLSRNALASELGISLQGVTCNCKKLLATGIIEEILLDRQKYYRLTDEALEIIDRLNLKTCQV
ncbi:MAG: winged helix-turn-helix transcriptional regulator [Candidatus Odinarchaeota archaeon]